MILIAVIPHQKEHLWKNLRRTEQFQYLVHTHVMFLLRSCSYQYSFLYIYFLSYFIFDAVINLNNVVKNLILNMPFKIFIKLLLSTSFLQFHTQIYMVYVILHNYIS